jgi:hypothetical protein
MERGRRAYAAGFCTSQTPFAEYSYDRFTTSI